MCEQGEGRMGLITESKMLHGILKRVDLGQVPLQTAKSCTRMNIEQKESVRTKVTKIKQQT